MHHRRTNNNRGDIDDLPLSNEEEDNDAPVSDTVDIYELKSRFKGKIKEYDQDYQSNSILMERNPLETFSKINIDLHNYDSNSNTQNEIHQLQ